MKTNSSKFKFSTYTLFSFLIILLASSNICGQTNFEQHSIDPDHTAISGITCVDYDQDNDIDIIACHRVLNQVLLWENDGNIPAGWTKYVVSNLINDPLYIYSGDINSDDFPDLVISSANTNTLYCLLNLNGENNWDEFIIDDGFDNAHGVCISDINGDGLTDIAGTAGADNTIAWWENNGNNPDEWSKHLISNQMNGTQTVTIADINNDDYLDIIGASSDLNKVVVWLNNGETSPSFTQQVANETLQLPHWVSTADIDSDNDLDIIVAACVSGKISWLRNDGGNPIIWVEQTIGNNFGCALTAEAADFDLDGDLDVAATAFGTNRVAWWEQQQSGTQITWTIHTLSANYQGAWPLVLSDIDKDSDTDIVTGGDLLNGLGNESPLSWWENKTVVSTGTGNNTINPYKFSIWPQPAMEKVQISYQLPEDSNVSVVFYDPLGIELGTAFSEFQQAGDHHRVLDLNSPNFKTNAGLFYCKLIVNNKTYINKLIIANQQ